jgi:hypothetical protein
MSNFSNINKFYEHTSEAKCALTEIPDIKLVFCQGNPIITMTFNFLPFPLFGGTKQRFLKTMPDGEVCNN